MVIFKRLYSLLISTPFWIVTALCNTAVLISACSIYYLEHDSNPQLSHFMDAIWWSFSTVTTVGYGDITPKTIFGKVIGIMLMIGGTGLFATYTALFANAMLGHKFARLGRKVIKEEKQIHTLDETLQKLEERISTLENRGDK